jgi:hypothetical protein
VLLAKTTTRPHDIIAPQKPSMAGAEAPTVNKPVPPQATIRIFAISICRTTVRVVIGRVWLLVVICGVTFADLLTGG